MAQQQSRGSSQGCHGFLSENFLSFVIAATGSGKAIIFRFSHFLVLMFMLEASPLPLHFSLRFTGTQRVRWRLAEQVPDVMQHLCGFDIT